MPTAAVSKVNQAEDNEALSNVANGWVTAMTLRRAVTSLPRVWRPEQVYPISFLP
jgi:hypothetical protein